MKRPINRPFLLTRLLFAVVVCLTAGNAVAQDFRVRSFRTLVNDITAYIAPVRDLNDEACALIKVVGDEDFVFSSPLGIVKRKNEVGEIWIYLPAGSVMMTIKHPRWGVLRDYRFPTPLESRMTYEIRLTPPLDYRRPLEMPELSRRPGSLSVGRPLLNTLPTHPVTPLRRPRERLQGLAMLQAGFRDGRPSIGIRLGVMRRHGAYLLGQTDLHGFPATEGTCDKNGTLDNGNMPYYTGQKRENRWIFLAGGIHRIAGEWCLYEGIGYGQRNLAWEQSGGIWTRNSSYTHRGLAAETGALYRFYHWTVSAGVLTLQGKYWEATVAIGWRF